MLIKYSHALGRQQDGLAAAHVIVNVKFASSTWTTDKLKRKPRKAWQPPSNPLTGNSQGIPLCCACGFHRHVLCMLCYRRFCLTSINFNVPY